MNVCVNKDKKKKERVIERNDKKKKKTLRETKVLNDFLSVHAVEFWMHDFL